MIRGTSTAPGVAGTGPFSVVELIDSSGNVVEDVVYGGSTGRFSMRRRHEHAKKLAEGKHAQAQVLTACKAANIGPPLTQKEIEDLIVRLEYIDCEELRMSAKLSATLGHILSQLDETIVLHDLADARKKAGVPPRKPDIYLPPGNNSAFGTLAILGPERGVSGRMTGPENAKILNNPENQAKAAAGRTNFWAEHNAEKAAAKCPGPFGKGCSRKVARKHTNGHWYCEACRGAMTRAGTWKGPGKGSVSKGIKKKRDAADDE
ncbi:alpha amylase catalytic region [Chlorella sorokiniana]|uniref:Alpha amylase catalytic region n=1 Tax=Chlorella sorokiniana TaxID=3076 RepID=A0A2P6TSM1_CHLSO|nr:alpha amylase catalytic region [Chlorella sorokiniana]|eukprot:PRW57067.1 alpha amylase catalytic region [Chlorella sorokiniana]